MALHLKKCLKQFPYNVYPIPKVHTWENVSIALKIYIETLSLLWENKKKLVCLDTSVKHKRKDLCKKFIILINQTVPQLSPLNKLHTKCYLLI